MTDFVVYLTIYRGNKMSSPMWDELRALEKKFKEKPAYSPMPKWED